MRALACLVFVTLAYVIQGAPSPQIDGKDASIGKFPYQVSIRFFGSHRCSGSIFNNFNVLTAANCVDEWKNMLEYVKIHVGTNFLNVDGGVYDIANIIIHENYNYIVNDIALIHLKTSIRYNTLVRPINLMTSDEDLGGKQCTLSGWGNTKINGEYSNNLQEVDLTVYPQEACKRENWMVTNTHICTFIKGKGFCEGDSGDPLVINGAQIGIASSMGYSCGFEIPNVYTRVSSFIPWITANLKNY